MACSVLAARAEPDTAHLIEALHQRRMSYLQALPTWSRFGKGWASRCAKVRDASLALVRANPVEARVPAAAGKGALIAAIATAVAAMLPALLDQAGATKDAVSGGDWQALAMAIATAAGAGIGAWSRYRSWRAAR